MPEPPSVRVTGHVRLPPDAPAVPTADLIVQVEDVSRADAPSEVVGEVRRHAAELAPGATLPFDIEIPADRVDPRHSYSVRAHVDVSGTGRVERGDLITTQSFPVLTREYGTDVTVTVRLI